LEVRTYDTDGKITQVDSSGLKTYGYDDAFRISADRDAFGNRSQTATG
jgi:RHS Repeat